jgi:fucose 4-O-acetylase-like acetyltransferase
MPLFFFVSGFLSAKLAEQAPRVFAANAIQTIIIPYFVWSWIFLLISAAFPNDVNNHLTPASFYRLAAPGMWVGVYWFLYALFIARLAYYFAARQSSNAVVAVFAASAVAYLACVLISANSVVKFEFVGNLSKVSMAGTFVGFGLIAATNHRIKDIILSPKFLPIWLVGWIAATTLIVCSEEFAPLRFMTGFLGTALTLSLARQIELKSDYQPRFLSQIGMATLAIYVSHVIFAAGMRSVLFKFGVHSAFINVVMGTLAGVMLPMILFYVANYLRIAPQVGLGKNAPIFNGGLSQPVGRRN